MKEVCDHCGQGLGEHLVPDSRCPTPGATTHFFMAFYTTPSSEDLDKREQEFGPRKPMGPVE